MRYTKIFCIAALSGAMIIGADPASAKSGSTLNAPTQVKAGQRFVVSATGGSDAFGGMAYRMCIDKKMGNAWRPQACITIAGSHAGSTQTNQPAVSTPRNAQYSVAFYRISGGKLISRGSTKTVKIVP